METPRTGSQRRGGAGDVPDQALRRGEEREALADERAGNGECRGAGADRHRTMLGLTFFDVGHG